MERTKILYGSEQNPTKDLAPSDLDSSSSSDGKHTQTESLTSNDVAVNTGKYSLDHLQCLN